MYELHVRTANYVRTKAYKCMETGDQSFSVPFED